MKKKLESFIDKAIELLDIVIVKINLLKTLISFHLGRNSEIGENKRFSLTHLVQCQISIFHLISLVKPMVFFISLREIGIHLSV